MIVTTNGTSVFKNGAYDNTVEQLNKAGVASVLFNEVQANPLKSTVMNGAAFVRKISVTLSLHWAAAVLWMLPSDGIYGRNPGDLWGLYCGRKRKRSAHAGETAPPIVCITTTARHRF